MPEKQNVKILIIDDDPVVRNFLRSVLKEKAEIFAVEAPSVAFRILKNESVDIIICDFKLPEMDGLHVLEQVKSDFPEIAVIMISSAGDMDTVITALRKGAADYLKKPLSANEIWVAIERTRKYSEISNNLDSFKKKNLVLTRAVNTEFEELIGNSEVLNRIRQQMRMVAATPDTTVLITGESGTGKELVARGIHNFSSRKDELFSAVNMSAVPESLFESEFFGHKKGSFTGAAVDKAGWFETTNGGSLFLDEIGEMSMSLQVKLLRVLEERKFTKVGTQAAQSFDIRIIAATNRPMNELSSGKAIRLDLFHRLGTFNIEIPPLREHKEDIPELAEYFIGMLSKKIGKNIERMHRDVLAILQAYSFPGNIREMKNIIERAIIICDKRIIMPEHIMLPGPMANNESSFLNTNGFDLEEIEKQTIIEALRKADFNKAEAARLLNIEWNALYRRIKKFGIELP
jgi:DNA-binding NtrC family response regulator